MRLAKQASILDAPAAPKSFVTADPPKFESSQERAASYRQDRLHSPDTSLAKLYAVHKSEPDAHVIVSNELRDQLKRTLAEDQAEVRGKLAP